MDNVWTGKAPHSKSALDTRYMPEVPDHTQSKEMFVIRTFAILLGHMVWRQGLMVDPAKIMVIINLEAPRSVKQLCTILGHTRYYRKFIKIYAQIIVPMEKLLKKDATFCWNEEC